MKTVTPQLAKQLDDHSAATPYKTVKMGMSSDAVVHLMGLLTNLYSDPVTATLREIVSNGLDAHTKSGQTRAVDVTLPSSKNDWSLIVRDYGAGMDMEQIVNVYSQYGASSKRENNLEKGGFGLGAKSPLALVDRFDVISIKDGVRIEFFVEKNPVDGAPEIKIVSEKPAEGDHSGVTVTVPYGYEDGAKIRDIRVIGEMFKGSPKGSLLVNGQKLTDRLDNTDLYIAIGGTDDNPTFWVDRFNLTARKDGDRARTSLGGFERDHLDRYAGKINVAIGGIVYDFSASQANNFPASVRSDFENLKDYEGQFVLNVPIGTVDLTPSREALIYSDRTMTVLAKVIEQTVSEFDDFVNSEMNRKRSILEATQYAYMLVDCSYWNVNVSGLKWHGKQVELTHRLTNHSYTVLPPSSSLYRRGNTSEATKQRPNLALGVRSILSDEYLLLTTSLAKMDEDAKRVRRVVRAIRDLRGYKQVALVSKDEDDAKSWFHFLYEDYAVDVNEFLTGLKAEQAEIRRKAKAENPTVRRPAAKRVLAFLWETEKDEDGVIVAKTVRKAYKGDATVQAMVDAGTVLYLHESDPANFDVTRGGFPYYYMTATAGEELERRPYNPAAVGALFNEILDAVYPDMPVFLINSRSSIDKFLATFPKAKNVIPAMREYAQAQFVTTSDTLSWDMVVAQNKGNSTYLLGSAREHYKVLNEAGLLEQSNNHDFDFLVEIENLYQANANKSAVAKERERIQKAYGHWFKGGTPDVEATSTVAERAVQIAEELYAFNKRYSLLLNMGSYALANQVKDEVQRATLLTFLTAMAENN